MNKVEQWKQQKHGFDVWPDLLRYSAEKRPMQQIDDADLERLKWYGVFYRKRDGDGTYMLRMRITAGELTSEQAKAIAYVAYQFGHGIVDITTRANIQVQGLSIGQVPLALSRLEAVGVTAKQSGHDNVRNVFGHPLAGIDPDELFDTRALCRQITELILDKREYADLPRKFNIALNGRSEHGLHYWTQDISYLARRGPDDDIGFQMLIGGTQGQNPHMGWHLPVFVRPEQIVPVTRSVLDLFRQQGSRERRDAARFRYLIEEIGIAGILKWLHEDLPFPLAPCIAEPTGPVGYDELIGWFRQKRASYWALGLCVPLGRLAWDQFEAVARVAKKWGDGTLRLTSEQGLIIPQIATPFKTSAATDAAAYGLSLHADTVGQNTVACTGKQFCNIGVTETKGHMFRLMDELRQRNLPLHAIRIHMSGCPASCAQHHTADIGLKGVRVRRLLGTREGFDVYLGGGIAGQLQMGAIYRLGVDVHQLPQLIEDVVREYYRCHQPGQTFSAYWREKLQGQQGVKVLDNDYQRPRWRCEACQHEFLGEDPPVFCPQCAGLRRNFSRWDDDAIEDPAPHGANVEGAAVAPTTDQIDPWLPIAQVEEIPPNTIYALSVQGKELAIIRHGDQIECFENACPHQGAPLTEGTLHGDTLTCPWHGWTFQLPDGQSQSPPGHCLQKYPTRTDQGRLLVALK